jgi:hypothetical protein
LRDFVHFTLIVLSQHPRFLNATDWLRMLRFEKDGETSGNIMSITHLHPEPWRISDIEDIKNLAEVTSTMTEHPYESVNYGYSAASAAIRFFSSLLITLHTHLRNVKLLEDHKAVANPECHMRGLIHFCRENAHLRIHRCVSLWNTVFPSNNARYYVYDGVDVMNDMLSTQFVTAAIGR